MGKSLLAVGASSELGLAAIRALHADYEVVAAHYNHMSEPLARLQEELGGKLVCFQADLSDEAQTRAMIQAVSSAGIVPDHILHFPAVPIQIRKFHKIPWEDIQREWDVSVRSAALVLQAFLPQMARAGGGRAVLMLSMVVNGMPPRHNADYVVVKHALLGLVRALAVEYADKGITVNGVSPALVQTKFTRNMHPYLIEQNAQLSPTGKNLTAEEVIPALRFLLSPEAAAINGQNISITCGR